MARVGGSAKGAGKKIRRAPPLDTSPEKQAQRGRKSGEKAKERAAINARAKEIVEQEGEGWTRARMRAWKERHPTAPAPHDDLSPKQARETFEQRLFELAPEAMDRMRDEILNPRSKDGAKLAHALIERVVGKAAQPVEVSRPAEELSDSELADAIAFIRSQLQGGAG